MRTVFAGAGFLAATVGLSEAALGAYLRSAVTVESAGLLPAPAAKRLAAPRAVQELVAAGLWVQADGGFQVKQIGADDPDHAKVELRRAKTRERVSRHREAKGNAPRHVTPNVMQKSVTESVTESVTPALQSVTVTPSVTLSVPPSQTLPSPNLSDSALISGSSDLSEASGSGSSDLTGIPRVAKPEKRRWTRVPAGWKPDGLHAEMARELGVELDIELAKFRDHEFKSPKSDAAACFRTWLRNAAKFSTPPGAREHAARMPSPPAHQGVYLPQRVVMKQVDAEAALAKLKAMRGQVAAE